MCPLCRGICCRDTAQGRLVVAKRGAASTNRRSHTSGKEQIYVARDAYDIAVWVLVPLRLIANGHGSIHPTLNAVGFVGTASLVAPQPKHKGNRRVAMLSRCRTLWWATPIYESPSKRTLQGEHSAVVPHQTDMQSMPSGAEKPFQCPDPCCGRRFHRKYTLTEHIKTHTGEKPHVCRAPRCKKRFSTSGNLTRHMRLHGPIDPLKCPFDGCSSTFMSEVKLTKHLQRHTTPRTHTCKISSCRRTFSTTGNLNRHMKRLHSELERTLLEDTVATRPSTELHTTFAVVGPSALVRGSPTSIEQDGWSTITSVSCSEPQLRLNSPPTPFEVKCEEPWSQDMLNILGELLLE